MFDVTFKHTLERNGRILLPGEEVKRGSHQGLSSCRYANLDAFKPFEERCVRIMGNLLVLFIAKFSQQK